MSEERGQLEEFRADLERVLCIVAHPDDIEYGTSAAVARWTAAGATVTYFLLTSGEAGIDTMAPAEAGPLREDEERASAEAVGVSEVDFAGYRDGAVVYSLDLRRDIAREIRRRRPQLVTTLTHAERFPNGFPNQADHRAVGLATLDAIADAGNRWIFPELVDEGFEPWHVRYLAVTAAATPTHYVDVTETFEAAVASLEEHRAYLAALPEDYPSPRTLLTGFLGPAGQAVGVDYALPLEVLDRG
ncbi:MAG: PIG-L deacetylase family protein [Actinomycetia bacterium]|nr:PIG-L deacetylase family protein [Actinomycetes bacterium]